MVDHILVVKRGAIVEQGSYDELMNSGALSDTQPPTQYFFFGFVFESLLTLVLVLLLLLFWWKQEKNFPN